MKRRFLIHTDGKCAQKDHATESSQSESHQSKRTRTGGAASMQEHDENSVATHAEMTTVDGGCNAGDHIATSVETRSLCNDDNDVDNDIPPGYTGYNTIALSNVRPLPQAPGRRGAEEEFLHTVPKSHGGPEKMRSIFCVWPRDPHGQHLIPEEKPRGALSPGGFPWGATLYDFYGVRRNPELHDMTYTTGSALCEAMAEMNEVDTARDEIEWASTEGKPTVLDIANTKEWIDHVESLPTPMSIVPFENQVSITLRERLPLYLLPDTIHVHDPFDVLPAKEKNIPDTTWNSQPDIVRTYKLNLFGSAWQGVYEARQKAEEMEEFKARTLVILRFKRTEEQIKNCEPEIEVPLPPYSRRVTKIQESHLYLSPAGKVGEGHHSIVYKGEWELPRDIFARPSFCLRCFKENVDKVIQRLNDTRRREKMLNVAGWGPNGFLGRSSTQAEQGEVNDPPQLENQCEIICVVPPDLPLPNDSSKIFEVIDRSGVWDELLKGSSSTNQAMVNLADEADGNGDGDSSTAREDSTCPRIRINPSFSYDLQMKCVHKPAGVPQTARFTVVAKLSIENDTHLGREAATYLEFPDYFFNHYNGYALMEKIHGIVPMGAIVPQFYGYYMPKKDQGQSGYISPILLLEHCGKCIEPQSLTSEEQEECVSLLLRFHRDDRCHESVAARNFLVEYGDTADGQTDVKRPRSNPGPSFRLIDFGRSTRGPSPGPCLRMGYLRSLQGILQREEEMAAARMFPSVNWIQDDD